VWASLCGCMGCTVEGAAAHNLQFRVAGHLGANGEVVSALQILGNLWSCCAKGRRNSYPGGAILGPIVFLQQELHLTVHLIVYFPTIHER